MCRVMNATSKPITWPARHAFAYLTPFGVNAVGVNLIDVTDCITQDRQHSPDVETSHKVHDEEYRGSAEPNMPSHEDRLSELTRLGIKVGIDGLTVAQAEKLTRILYSARDVMAESVTQVPEARVPSHTILLKDSKPVICKRFRYDPTKEQKLEALCDDLLNEGIIMQSSSLWNSPVFLTTKNDGSSRF